MRITEAVVIDRPLEEVWAAFDNGDLETMATNPGELRAHIGWARPARRTIATDLCRREALNRDDGNRARAG